MLSPTPQELLVDPQGRPYFLWDLDLDLASFERLLGHPDREVRAYFVAKLMRQAKPDDVFRFVSRGDLLELWPETEKYLGSTRDFWRWLLVEHDRQGSGDR